MWWDSRVAGATARLARAAGKDEAWRERVFTALFEEHRAAPDADTAVAWARELAWDLDPSALDAEIDALDVRTLEALDAEVTGVPTFMLGRWPVGGIQTDETMLHMLGRYARKRRDEGATT